MNHTFARGPSRAFENAQAGRDSWHLPRAPAGHTSYDTSVNLKSARENTDDYYKSKKNIEDDKGSVRTFYPVTEQWQKEKAERFRIKVVKSHKYGSMKNFYDMTAPKQTIPVEGDGNCFFRAISMCIIGSENEHMRVRELITKHVEENPEMYRTFLQSRGGMNQYLTSMRRPREWATDVEILAAATLLRTIIEVYFPCRVKGHIEFRWQTFKPLTHPDITHPAIYLSNKNDHFDPVLDVCIENDETYDTRDKNDTQSLRRSPNPSFAHVPSQSKHDHVRRSNHESSFSRVHGISTPNYSDGQGSRFTHPNVQF